MLWYVVVGIPSRSSARRARLGPTGLGLPCKKSLLNLAVLMTSTKQS